VGLRVGAAAGDFMLVNDFHEETLFSFSNRTPELRTDRRNDPRHLTILRVGALVGTAGRELCLIRNISAGGVMAHVYGCHPEGEAVAIELKSNQQITGRVVWAEGSNIGIRFHQQIDVADMLSSQAVIESGMRPRLPRVEVDRLATLRCGSRLYGVNTRDISQGGVKIESDEAIEPGTQVVLTMEKFRPIQGVIRWCTDGLAGIEFNQLIPFPELMAWLRPQEDARA
jgi:hypothetical protein